MVPWQVGGVEHDLVVLATPAREDVGDRIATQLAASGVATARQELAHPYYSGGLRYRRWATGSDGNPVPLADGGAFDWLCGLTSNRRAVFVASGLGSQLVPVVFRSPQQTSPAG